MTQDNPYNILSSFKRTAGLAHYFLESEIKVLGSNWYIQGRQEEDGLSATVIDTIYGCIKAEFAIRFLEDVVPQSMQMYLQFLEAVEKSSNGALKVITAGPQDFLIIFVVHLPRGYNEAHLSLLSAEVETVKQRCNQLDEMKQAMQIPFEKVEDVLANAFANDGAKDASNPNVSPASTWDSIKDLDKKSPKKEDVAKPNTNDEPPDISIEELPLMEEFTVEDILDSVNEKGEDKKPNEENKEDNTDEGNS